MIIQKKTEDFPIIYLRYTKGNLIYIGETVSFLKSRHLREDIIQAGNFDCVKILKASKNTTRRRYWEAVLILQLKLYHDSIECIQIYHGLVRTINNDEFVPGTLSIRG
jgi:hypothetical protein